VTTLPDRLAERRTAYIIVAARTPDDSAADR
jgi:hypothetical protein